MSEREILAELAKVRAQLDAANLKLERRSSGARGKVPVVRNQVIECMKASVGSPNHSVAVGILAKYLCPKKKDEDKAAWLERVAALAAEMS